MIEITKDQCTRMLVWDNDESKAKEETIAIKVIGLTFPYRALGGSYYRHAKPLPEEKSMTALDVMWWAGTRKVYVVEINGELVTLDTLSLNSETDISKIKWNELTRESGETRFKYSEWKEFTFANCDMEG
jgi:hypothetical protein